MLTGLMSIGTLPKADGDEPKSPTPPVVVPDNPFKFVSRPPLPAPDRLFAEAAKSRAAKRPEIAYAIEEVVKMSRSGELPKDEINATASELIKTLHQSRANLEAGKAGTFGVPSHTATDNILDILDIAIETVPSKHPVIVAGKAVYPPAKRIISRIAEKYSEDYLKSKSALADAQLTGSILNSDQFWVDVRVLASKDDELGKALRQILRDELTLTPTVDAPTIFANSPDLLQTYVLIQKLEELEKKYDAGQKNILEELTLTKRELISKMDAIRKSGNSYIAQELVPVKGTGRSKNGITYAEAKEFLGYTTTLFSSAATLSGDAKYIKAAATFDRICTAGLTIAAGIKKYNELNNAVGMLAACTSVVSAAAMIYMMSQESQEAKAQEALFDALGAIQQQIHEVQKMLVGINNNVSQLYELTGKGFDAVLAGQADIKKLLAQTYSAVWDSYVGLSGQLAELRREEILTQELIKQAHYSLLQTRIDYFLKHRPIDDVELPRHVWKEGHILLEGLTLGTYDLNWVLEANAPTQYGPYYTLRWISEHGGYNLNSFLEIGKIIAPSMIPQLNLDGPWNPSGRQLISASTWTARARTLLDYLYMNPDYLATSSELELFGSVDKQGRDLLRLLQSFTTSRDEKGEFTYNPEYFRGLLMDYRRAVDECRTLLANGYDDWRAKYFGKYDLGMSVPPPQSELDNLFPNEIAYQDPNSKPENNVKLSFPQFLTGQVAGDLKRWMLILKDVGSPRETWPARVDWKICRYGWFDFQGGEKVLVDVVNHKNLNEAKLTARIFVDVRAEIVIDKKGKKILVEKRFMSKARQTLHEQADPVRLNEMTARNGLVNVAGEFANSDHTYWGNLENEDWRESIPQHIRFLATLGRGKYESEFQWLPFITGPEPEYDINRGRSRAEEGYDFWWSEYDARLKERIGLVMNHLQAIAEASVKPDAIVPTAAKGMSDTYRGAIFKSIANIETLKRVIQIFLRTALPDEAQKLPNLKKEMLATDGGVLWGSADYVALFKAGWGPQPSRIFKDDSDPVKAADLLLTEFCEIGGISTTSLLGLAHLKTLPISPATVQRFPEIEALIDEIATVRRAIRNLKTDKKDESVSPK